MITDTRVRSLTKDEVLDREIQLGKRNATSTKPYRWVIDLSKEQTVRDINRGSGRSIYGPALVRYTMYSDGGIDVVIDAPKARS